MVQGIKDNFKSMYKDDMTCPLCNTHYDDQASLFHCPKILEDDFMKSLLSTCEYSDIFKNVEFQVHAVRVLEKVMYFREMKLLS